MCKSYPINDLWLVKPEDTYLRLQIGVSKTRAYYVWGLIKYFLEFKFTDNKINNKRGKYQK